MTPDVFDAVEQEYDALEAMLESLDDKAWATPSLCPGWSVADVVLHLAQSEETVGVSAGERPAAALEISVGSGRSTGTIDDVVEGWVASERDQPPRRHLDRWKVASRSALVTLKAADPTELFQWATNPLKPRTLATTRLSEHWIHANDIAQPLGFPYPDTARLWHIARLAHRTIPYAYGRAGRDDPPSVRVELVSPDQESWEFGPEDAECIVRGTASDFCRIAARRLAPAEAKSIEATGARVDEVLGLVRTYA
ncbi:MAG: maleylpyruvate isomerase family mycothiol-dependent enzyme [Actinomycetota bacterium]